MKKIIEEDSVIIYDDEIAQDEITYRITDNGGSITIDVTSVAGEFTGKFVYCREFDFHDMLNLLSICRRVYREELLTKKIGE